MYVRYDAAATVSVPPSLCLSRGIGSGRSVRFERPQVLGGYFVPATGMTGTATSNSVDATKEHSDTRNKMKARA